MARVSRWGNSLAVRLPAALGFEEGQEVSVRKGAEGELIVSVEEQEKRALEKKKAALARLASLNWELPPDYKFNREEANER